MRERKEGKKGRMIREAQEVMEHGQRLVEIGRGLLEHAATMDDEYDVSEQVWKEMRLASTRITGLRVDRNPLDRTWRLYYRAMPAPFMVMHDTQTQEYAETGPGALIAHIEGALQAVIIPPDWHADEKNARSLAKPPLDAEEDRKEMEATREEKRDV